MKVLLLEDEEKTARYIEKGLHENGFSVDVTVNGENAFYLAQSTSYDMIILDVMVPGQDGWWVLDKLRHQGLQTPVIFLTAKDSVEDRVKGLNLGADDYLIKPFAFSELLARIRSVLRRPPTSQPSIIRVADLEIDLSRHRVTRSGVRVDLTPKEFLLLALLARRDLPP
jgi:two-component system copper resistance phosphate regulon response regulator CusR